MRTASDVVKNSRKKGRPRVLRVNSPTAWVEVEKWLTERNLTWKDFCRMVGFSYEHLSKERRSGRLFRLDLWERFETLRDHDPVGPTIMFPVSPSWIRLCRCGCYKPFLARSHNAKFHPMCRRKKC